MNRSHQWIATRIAAPVTAATGLLCVWSVAVYWFAIPKFLVPTPAQVCHVLWQQRQTLMWACWLTGSAAIAGLALSIVAGTLVGVAFSQSRWLRYSLYPYAIFLQTVPIVAVAPLLVMWFGYGAPGVIAVAMILSVFPVIANVTAGMTSVPSPLNDLFALHHATRTQRLTKLQFPYAIPFLITGIRTSSGMAVIGAIVGEFFVGYGGTRFGLGYLIRAWAESYQTDALFAAVLLSTLLGVAIFATVSLIAEFGLGRYTYH